MQLLFLESEADSVGVSKDDSKREVLSEFRFQAAP
jgi:hypothetical protein